VPRRPDTQALGDHMAWCPMRKLCSPHLTSSGTRVSLELFTEHECVCSCARAAQLPRGLATQSGGMFNALCCGNP
jgi:hypothetical protein